MVFNLVLFKMQLALVTHVLPFAAATTAKVLANRFGAVLGQTVECDGFSFVVRLSFFKCLHIYEISGNGVGNKNDLPFRGATYGYAFCSRIEHFYLTEYLLLFIFS